MNEERQAQDCISALLSFRLSFVESVPAGRDGRDQAVELKERHEAKADIIDELGIRFDLIDGHWD
jgi:hypothetical protein